MFTRPKSPVASVESIAEFWFESWVVGLCVCVCVRVCCLLQPAYDVGYKSNPHSYQMVELCAECTMELGTRTCDQCEDLFCDACFPRVHRKGRLLKHTWTPRFDMCATCGSFVARLLCAGELQCKGCYEAHMSGAPATDIPIVPLVRPVCDGAPMWLTAYLCD